MSPPKQHVTGKRTGGPNIIPLERFFKLFSVRARPVAEARATLADPIHGLLAGAGLKEDHFRARPSEIMLGLGVNHCDFPIFTSHLLLHGAPRLASASVSNSAMCRLPASIQHDIQSH